MTQLGWQNYSKQCMMGWNGEGLSGGNREGGSGRSPDVGYGMTETPLHFVTSEWS